MPSKLKKSRKQRGSRYCGWGQVGQHRKGGMRGGKGKAGGRKHHWIRTVKYEPERYRKKGFTSVWAIGPEADTINVGELHELAIDSFGAEKIKSAPEDLSLDLKALGFEKLLGRGSISIPLKVSVPEYSLRAQEKLEAVGGQILESE